MRTNKRHVRFPGGHFYFVAGWQANEPTIPLLSSSKESPSTCQKKIVVEVDRALGYEIAREREKLLLMSAQFLALLSGVFVSLAPPIYFLLARDIESCYWKWGIVPFFGLGWGLFLAAMICGVVYSFYQTQAMLYNPHHWYGHVKDKRDGYQVYEDDVAWEQHQDYIKRMKRMLKRELYLFFFGIFIIAVALALAVIPVLCNW